MISFLTANLLLTARISSAGDSCVLTQDCDAGLTCIEQVCAVDASACQRTQDCQDGQRCRDHVCVTEAVAPRSETFPPPTPTAFVRIRASNQRAALVQAKGPLGDVRASCNLPCVLDLPLGRYAIVTEGPRLRATQEMIDVRGDMNIVVTPELGGVYLAGMVLEIAGGVSALAGGITLLSGVKSKADAALFTGITLVGAGFVMSVIVGPILFAVSGAPIDFGWFPLILLAPLPKGGEMALNFSW